jgi:hypothetical protein
MGPQPYGGSEGHTAGDVQYGVYHPKPLRACGLRTEPFGQLVMPLEAGNSFCRLVADASISRVEHTTAVTSGMPLLIRRFAFALAVLNAEPSGCVAAIQELQQ